MAFVVSDGQMMGLERPSLPRAGRVLLSANFSTDYATIWRTQPHVRTVIGFLARNIAQIGLHTFERTSDTDRKRLGLEHPLARLIAQPNPKTTRYRLIDGLVNDLGIFDIACWAKVTTKTQPEGLLRLPPQQIEPLGESWAWPEGIRFKGNRGSVDLVDERIVLFRGYNPTDARWGVSPMETLRQILAEEYQASLYREQLWRNGARFPGYISRPKSAGDWSDTARERFRSDWRGLYTGAGPGAGGTPILEDDMKFEPGGITPAQAQYLETRKLTREEVAAAFHIPLPMVGILDHATFSNIEEQHKNLYQDTLGPWLEMIQQEIGLQLVSDFDASGKVYVEFNLAEKMKGSFEEQASSLQSSVGAPWLSRNEARGRMNLPQIDGGDDLVVPLNVLVGGQASPTDSAPKAALPRQKSAGIKARAANTYVTKHEQVLGAFFRRQAAVVKSRLGSKAADDWWDEDRWDKELAGDIFALAVATSEHVAKSVFDSVGASPDDYDVDRTLAFLTVVTARVASSVNAVTKTQLDDALGADDPAEAIANVFEIGQTSRSQQIAKTSVTDWSGFGTVEGAKQALGDNATKTWVTGENPRPEHEALDGETVPIDEQFSDGSQWPGGLPGCNCDIQINAS